VAELTGAQKAKYKEIIAGALEQAEGLCDTAGVQLNAEAYRVRNVPRHVRPDPVALAALLKLHQGLGETIRLLVQTSQELDNIELVDGLDDLGDLRDTLGGQDDTAERNG
jgi:hypothetical protein